MLTICNRLTFKFDEINLLPKGKPVYFSKQKSLLICSKNPRETSNVCITIWKGFKTNFISLFPFCSLIFFNIKKPDKNDRLIIA